MVKVMWISDEEMTKDYEEFSGHKIRDTCHVFGMCDSVEFSPVNSHHTISLNTIISRLEHPVYIELIVLAHETISLFFASPILKLDYLWDMIFHSLFHDQFNWKKDQK